MFTMADDSKKLLQEYVRNRSDDAIRALVSKHSAIVYSTALRCLNGDRAAAQDVTQEVFLLLLRKASGLQGVLLSGWLYRQACRRASNYMRSESRRRHRERAAADEMDRDGFVQEESPFLSRELDDALLSLPSADRDAVVLRFFEGKDFRGVGSALEISEDAARKKVKRALDRLGEILKKRGREIGGGSLEVTLLGMECQPTPQAFLSVLTTRTARAAASIAGGSTALAILKPFLGGSVAASLVVGTAMSAAAPAADSEHDKSSSASQRSPERRPRPAAEEREISPLEKILEEIRRARTGPENSLTKLKLEAILSELPENQIPQFIALAEKALPLHDQAAVYEPLLKQWAKKDPGAALDFIARENVGKRIDIENGTNLLQNVFSDWSRKDRNAASDWLVKNWEVPGLSEQAFMTSLRIFLAMDVSDALFRSKGVGPMLEFVAKLPEPERMDVLGVAVGDSRWHTATPQLVPASRLLEFHRAIQSLPDGNAVMALTTRFWRHVASHTHSIDELRSEFTPMEKFQVALGEMNVLSTRKYRVKPRVGEGPVSYDRVTNHAEREKAAMKAGEDAGLSQKDVIMAVGRAVFASGNTQRINDWYTANGGRPEFDDVLAEMATEAASANGWSGNRLPEMKAIGWSSKISDPERRISMSRGAFIRLIARDPAAARRFAEQEPLPADVASELKSMLTTNP